MAQDNKKVFSDDFLWGASVSAHQAEGGNHNQWTVWELAHAAELAKTAEKRLGWMPSWPDIKTEAANPNSYISGDGVKHYQKFEDDFDILQKLNLNSFRFSIEWSRLEPEPGQWNQAEIEHYRSYIKALKSRGIEPVLNIWHWTHPVWFGEMGGFKYRRNLKYFERLVQKIVEEYGDDVKYYLTINEPIVYSVFGYLRTDTTSGMMWPPAEKSAASLLRVFWNLVQAHRRAYKIIKRHRPSAMVGIASQLGNIQAKDSHDIFDTLSTKLMRAAWNWAFLHRIRRQQDFVGINYYFTSYYDNWFREDNPKLPLNDLGWYMEPEGLYPLLLRTWAHYKKPIMISENGVADQHDQFRQWWIEETIVAMERSMSQGVKIIGYFHWSLLDNFEWATGWLAKFGLVEVDRQNGMKRTIRPSGRWLAERIKKLS